MAGQQKAVASLHRDLSRELPTVLMIGPRPRPAPPRSSREGRARGAALTERLVACLVHHVLPHAARRTRQLGKATGPAVVLRLGGTAPPVSSQPSSSSDAPIASSAAEVETVGLCTRLLQSLAPKLRITSIWLPSPPSLAVPIPALLDDEAAALASAPIVLIEYREDAPQDGGKSVQDDERAALVGAYGWSHLNYSEANAYEKHEHSYTVAWSPGVVVREAPSREAPVVGMRRAGSVVTTTRKRGAWVEINELDAGKSSGGWDGNSTTPSKATLPLRERNGGWMLADGDAHGFGRILDPKESDHKWYCGRDKKALTQLESSLQAWKRHPVLRLLKVEHTLHGLPLIATEDAPSLLGAGRGGARLFPWRVRSLRGQANAFAATLPPPPPPTDYSPVKQADSYAPPKAYEAGANMFGAHATKQPQHSQHSHHPLPSLSHRHVQDHQPDTIRRCPPATASATL